MARYTSTAFTANGSIYTIFNAGAASDGAPCSKYSIGFTVPAGSTITRLHVWVEGLHPASDYNGNTNPIIIPAVVEDLSVDIPWTTLESSPNKITKVKIRPADDNNNVINDGSSVYKVFGGPTAIDKAY